MTRQVSTHQLWTSGEKSTPSKPKQKNRVNRPPKRYQTNCKVSKYHSWMMRNGCGLVQPKIRYYLFHIFQNTQVTSNKMVHKKRHHFLAQFSMPFHMVWSVLLQVLAQKTTFWLVEILWQPIRSFYSMVFEAITTHKKRNTSCERVLKSVL